MFQPCHCNASFNMSYKEKSIIYTLTLPNPSTTLSLKKYYFKRGLQHWSHSKIRDCSFGGQATQLLWDKTTNGDNCESEVFGYQLSEIWIPTVDQLYTFWWLAEKYPKRVSDSFLSKMAWQARNVTTVLQEESFKRFVTFLKNNFKTPIWIYIVFL